jgi:L-aspartate oxidase
MEAVVMAGRAAKDIEFFVCANKEAPRINMVALPQLNARQEMPAERDMLRHIMTDMVGVIRDARGMREAICNLELIGRVAETLDPKTADMALVARMIAVSALKREESRGGHCRADFPKPLRQWQKRSFVTMKEIDLLTVDMLSPAREGERVA